MNPACTMHVCAVPHVRLRCEMWWGFRKSFQIWEVRLSKCKNQILKMDSLFAVACLYRHKAENHLRVYWGKLLVTVCVSTGMPHANEKTETRPPRPRARKCPKSGGTARARQKAQNGWPVLTGCRADLCARGMPGEGHRSDFQKNRKSRLAPSASHGSQYAHAELRPEDFNTPFNVGALCFSKKPRKQ